MANSITRCALVIMLSLACFSSLAFGDATHLGLFSEHEKPVYLAAFNNKQRISSVPVSKTALEGSSMELIFQRDYPIRQIVRHIGSWALIGNKANPVYANTVNSNSLAAIYQLNKQLFDIKSKTSLNKGDVLRFIENGQQTIIRLNDTDINHVNDPVFYYYLANMWLGESAASKSFQQQLLSPNSELQVLYKKHQPSPKPVAKNTQALPKTKENNNTKQHAATATAKTTPKPKIAPKAKAPSPSKKTIAKPAKATASKTTSAQKAAAKPEQTKLKQKTKAPVAKTKPQPAKPAPKKPSKPSYQPKRQAFAQAQQSNHQRLLLAIENASFPVEEKAIDAVILFTDQNGQVINAKVVSSTLKDTALLSKKLAFISQDISPIVTTDAMQQPGIYAFRVNFKP